MAEQVRQPYYKSGSTTDRVEQTTPSVEQKTTSVTPPTAEAQQYLEQQLGPLRKQYGILPDGQSDPFRVLGYKPEERQADIASQRELEAWKQKEAGIYNGIALAVDAMTAGLGGNVQRRDVGNLAAEAANRQQQLDMLNRQQTAAEQEKLRQNAASYAGLVNKLTEDYLQKVVTTQKSGGEKLVRTTKTPETGYTTRAIGGAGSSGDDSGGGNGKKWLFTTTVNSGENAGKHVQHDLTEQQYKNVAGVLLARYKSILSDPSVSQGVKDSLTAKLKAAKILSDDGSTEKWDTDQIMRNGKFWMLTDGDRELINRYTDGKVVLKAPDSGQSKKAPYLNSQNGNENKKVAPYLKQK